MEPIQDTIDPQAITTSKNPHVLWKQLLGFFIWVALFSYFSGVVVAAMSLALGGVTFADAWKSGIYKDAEKKSFLNISPMAWGIVMPFLLFVAYLVYLINRNKLRTIQAGNGFFIAIIIIGGVEIAFTIVMLIIVSNGIA